MIELQRLHRAFGEIDPRSAQVLRRGLLEGRSRASAAVFYGVSPSAFDVMVWRSCSLLAAHVAGPAPQLLPWSLEQECARHLRERLDGRPVLESQTGPLSSVLSVAQQLTAAREALLEAIQQAESQAEARRARPWVDRLRRFAVALIAAAALYWYWHKDPPTRVPTPPVLRAAPPSRSGTPSRVHR